MTQQEKWNPDPKVILRLKQSLVEKSDKDQKIAVGSRVLTWSEVFDEVVQGTKFGKRFYNAFVKTK